MWNFIHMGKCFPPPTPFSFYLIREMSFRLSDYRSLSKCFHCKIFSPSLIAFLEIKENLEQHHLISVLIMFGSFNEFQMNFLNWVFLSSEHRSKRQFSLEIVVMFIQYLTCLQVKFVFFFLLFMLRSMKGWHH